LEKRTSTTRQIKKDFRNKRKKQDEFLQYYSQFASITRAAKKAKINRDIHYDWMKDEDYKLRYIEASERATQALEDEAARRAAEGVLEPVFHQGQAVGSIRKYSDTLLIVLMKARAPEKYKDRFYGEFSGPNGKPIPVDTTGIDYTQLSDEVLTALHAAKKPSGI
jgi:hypothetical protein